MDARYRAANTRKWYKSINKDSMTAVVEVAENCDSCDESENCPNCGTGDGCFYDITVPIEYQVCPFCRGKGTHVNPAIDSQGISPEEFEADPFFFEDYRRGVYDVPCYKCGGANVVPILNKRLADKELADKINKLIYEIECEGYDDAKALEMGY